MKVKIDSELCTGHGRCYSLASDVFDADDEGRGFVISAEVSDALREQAMTAVRSCPEQAISVEEV